MPDQPTNSPLILHTDPEHNGIRLAVPFLLVLGVAAGYGLLNLLLALFFPALDTAGLLACAGGAPLGLGLAAAGENWLKRVWHSGTRLVCDEQGMAVWQGSRPGQSFLTAHELHLLAWQFTLTGYPRGGRERRVPEGWLCLAGQIQQDENQVVLYCYLSPKAAGPLLQQQTFHKLNIGDVYDNSVRSRMLQPTRPKIPSQVIAGKAGRYWLGERNRWHEGLELSPQDFLRLLTHLQQFQIATSK